MVQNTHLMAAASLLMLAWPAAAQMSLPAGASQQLDSGSMALACMSLSVGGTLQLENGQVQQAGGVSLVSGGVIQGGNGLMEIGGNWHNAGTFNADTSTVRFTDVCGTHVFTLTGRTTFHSLTFTQTGSQPLQITMPPQAITVTSAFALDAAQPIAILGPACAGILLGPGVAAPPAGSITLAPGTWISDTRPAGCPADTDTTTATHAIPTLSGWSLVLLALGLLATAACARRQSRK